MRVPQKILHPWPSPLYTHRQSFFHPRRVWLYTRPTECSSSPATPQWWSLLHKSACNLHKKQTPAKFKQQPLWNSGLSPHGHHEWVGSLSISISLSFPLSAVTWVSQCCILSSRSCWEITGLLGKKAAKCNLDFTRHVPLFFFYMDVECLSKFRVWRGLWSPAHWPNCRSNNPWVL